MNRSISAAGPVPVFLGLNCKGNHATTDEPDVAVSGIRMPEQTAEPRVLHITRLNSETS